MENSEIAKGSYLKMRGEVGLKRLTVGQLIHQSARKFGDKEALIFSFPTEIRKTFAELKTEVDILGAGILSLGLKKGDRLGIWGPNSYEWYLTHAAALKAGLIVVNINPAFQTTELAYCLAKVGMKCLVIAGQYKTSDYYQILLETIPEIAHATPGQIRSPLAPSFTTLISFQSAPPSGGFGLKDVLELGSKNCNRRLLWDAESLISSDDVCNIQFTSGTTGNPKGVMLSHHNIVNNGFFVGQRFSYHQTDIICVPVPLFHCFGSVVGGIAAMHFGATCLFPSPAFSTQQILNSIHKYRCTVVYGTPTMHIDVLHNPGFETYDLSSLRLAVTGASSCPEELIKQMKRMYTVHEVGSLYGMTETSPISLQSLPTDSDRLRAETVGYPLDHTEIKLVNEEGETVSDGDSGELCVRGYLNMVGYWDDPEITNETIDSEGWLHTGDIGKMLGSGHVKIVGRLKDLIIRGGENIYPKEVEDFLYGIPEVQEAHVFGVPDIRFGEEVAVWISIKIGHVLTQDQLKAKCHHKIAYFKIPRYVIFTKEFPKTASGKIQKWRMRDEMITRLGAQNLAALENNNNGI